MIKRPSENNSVLLYFWNFSETSAQLWIYSSLFYMLNKHVRQLNAEYLSAKVWTVSIKAWQVNDSRWKWFVDEKLFTTSCRGVSSMSPALLYFLILMLLRARFSFSSKGVYNIVNSVSSFNSKSDLYLLSSSEILEVLCLLPVNFLISTAHHWIREQSKNYQKILFILLTAEWNWIEATFSNCCEVSSSKSLNYDPLARIKLTQFRLLYPANRLYLTENGIYLTMIQLKAFAVLFFLFRCCCDSTTHNR